MPCFEFTLQLVIVISIVMLCEQVNLSFLQVIISDKLSLGWP